ncbi:Pam17-domain-containing protein [Nemania sp. FL0916]|nr:Pam17-domain-containing protein [Nemania sp. FL0916]
MLTPTTTAAAVRLATFSSRGLQLVTPFARGQTCPFAASPFSSLARQTCAVRTPPSRPLSTRITFPNSSVRKPAPPQCQFAARRSASTAAAEAGPSSSSSATVQEPAKLDWNHFFQLRKTRRRFQLASSLVTMSIGGTGGALLLVNMNMDWLLSKVPMDPIFALGIITLSFAGLGWLAGPSLGSAIFYTIKRGVKRPMALKESEFFSRIKKNRVDPSNSSLSGNAVPDFYGEKISSVAGYRQWLKDQRAFNKKRTNFV